MKNSRSTEPPGSKNGRGRTFPFAAAELLRQATAMAERELSLVPEDTDDPAMQKAMKIAEIAEANWREAWDASQRMPGVIQPRELERLCLAAEVARLRLEQTFTVQVQSTLDRMKSGLEELCQKLMKLEISRARVVSSQIASRCLP